MRERLQKIISAAGICSRRAAERLLQEGRVTVNGAVAALGESADLETDEVHVDGKLLSLSGEHSYILLNKPRGYVTTLHDEKGRKTVAELVADLPARVYPVGRLDLNSDGLLLLTDDGALAQRLMHPSHAVDKVYRTVVEGDVETALPVLRGPMTIDGYPIAPAGVRRIGERTLEITIHEGRNRQVRKMCAAAGLRVLHLTRIAEGPLRLGELPSGKWRYLTAEELRKLGVWS